MGLSIRQGAAPASWYVPEWGGNRQSADPIAVLIQPLTAAQAQAALERHMAGQKMGSAKHVLKASRAHRDAVIADLVRTNGPEFLDRDTFEAVKRTSLYERATFRDACDDLFEVVRSDVVDPAIRRLERFLARLVRGWRR